ncbi:MAG: acetyl-CoA C-acyltransferase [Bacteroidetes bacterium]|nr:acetyl-CoA C-acyltransferase [Bacteroidota bacterium]
MQTAYVIDAVRTPIGKYGGALAMVRPDDLLALVIRSLIERNPGIDPSEIEDVIAGAANQAGEDNRNVARMSALLAGLPLSVAGSTVNRLCASGLEAIQTAARAIMCGDGDLFIAGGVESMSRAPYVIGKPEAGFSRGQKMEDTTMGWRFINKKLSALHHPFAMGETAENVAERYQVSREAQDEFAHHTQEKYAAADASGRFNEELIAVAVPGPKGTQSIVSKDEHPRRSSIEQLAKLKPAFKAGGSVTAGNSSGINDGASALLLASEQAVKKYGLKPLAKVTAMAVAGVEPSHMGMGPVPATRKALMRAGLKATDLSLIELNEAFAAQAIPCMSELELDATKVNVNGGAIALGHPLGCSGARIATTLLHELKKRGGGYGLATMCIGVGQGSAIIFES